MREHLVHGNKQICFSRWTRKSYAVFNSLKKQIKISCLAIALLNISFVAKVEAQQDTTKQLLKEHQLEEVEVIGQKAPVVFSESSRVVTIISQKEIESSPARSLSDVLQYVSGLDVRQRGSSDVQADINLRSGGFDQTLILLDGIVINDPQTGHHSFDLPVALDQIERIEILKGPGSRVLGPNAYSGAINIISKKAHSNEVSFFAKAGDFGTFDVGSSLSYGKKNCKQFLSINVSESDGYRHNTDFSRYSFLYNGSIKKKKHQFKWQLSPAMKSFGANSFYSARYPNQYEETKTIISGIQHEFSGKIKVKSSLSYRMHYDRFELFRRGENAALWYKNPNFHLNQSISVNSVASYTTRFGKTAFGFDYRFEDIQSNVLGIFLKDTINSFLDKESFFTRYDKRNYVSVYTEQSIMIRRFSVSAGLMANYNNYQNKFNYFPGVDISVKLTKFLKWYSSFNSSLRLPSFTDLYYQGPSNIGNPDLKPETSKSIETGYMFNKKYVVTGFSFYYSLGENTIDWIRKSTTEKWQAKNITSVESIGYETFLLLKAGKRLEKYFESLEINVSQNRFNSYSGDWISNYSLDFLVYKLSLKMHHRFGKNITMNWALRTQDRNGDYLKYDAVKNVEVPVSYKAFTVMDIRLNYQWKQAVIFVGANNLFDSEYFDFGNIPMAGRWFYGGFNYKIALNQRVKKM